MAAEPVEELGPTALDRDEDGVVQGDEAAAALHLLRQDGEPVAFEERVRLHVAVAAVAEYDDRVGVVERLRVGRPAVEVEFGLEAGEVLGRVEAELDEAEALLVFVVAGAVALLAGDEDDLFRLGGLGQQEGRDEGEREDRQRERPHGGSPGHGEATPVLPVRQAAGKRFRGRGHFGRLRRKSSGRPNRARTRAGGAGVCVAVVVVSGSTVSVSAQKDIFRAAAKPPELVNSTVRVR